MHSLLFAEQLQELDDIRMYDLHDANLVFDRRGLASIVVYTVYITNTYNTYNT